MRRTLMLIAVLLLPITLLAQSSFWVKDGLAAVLVTVDANQNLRVALGPSGFKTYVFSDGDGIGDGFVDGGFAGYQAGELVSWCINFVNGDGTLTGASRTFVLVNRNTDGSSTANFSNAYDNPAPTIGTGTVSTLDWADGNFNGQLTSVISGTGPLLDRVDLMVGEFDGTSGNYPGQGPFCKRYGLLGEKRPRFQISAVHPASTTQRASGIGISTSSITNGIVGAVRISATFLLQEQVTP